MKSKINKGLLVLTIALSIGLVAVIFMPNYRVDKAKAQTEGLSAEMQEILTMKTEIVPNEVSVKMSQAVVEEDHVLPVEGVDFVYRRYGSSIRSSDVYIKNGYVYESIVEEDGGEVMKVVKTLDPNGSERTPMFRETWCVEGEGFTVNADDQLVPTGRSCTLFEFNYCPEE